MSVSEVADRLRIRPWDFARRRELEMYLEDLGPEALERQVQLGIERFNCCWELREVGHHRACPDAPPLDQPSLLG